MVNITREDIYNIIVPLGVVMVGRLIQFIMEHVAKEKQWKHMKEKSPLDSFMLYYIWTILLGGVFLILFYILFLYYEIFLGFKFSPIFIKICYTILSILYHVYFFIKVERKITFKKKYKHKELLALIMKTAPILFSCGIWSFILFDAISIIRAFIFCFILVFEFIIFAVLDSNSSSKYQYATFYFYGGNIVYDIVISNISQKGNWVIARNKNSSEEYRFRIKDIERVEYKNYCKSKG